MSNFNCEHCGALCCDSERGYTTGCEHYPPDVEPMKSTDTDTLVQALRILARDIYCEDGIATSVIREAADRIEKLDKLATDVLRASHRGDQNFVPCLRVDTDDAYKLGLALVRLGEQMREW